MRKSKLGRLGMRIGALLLSVCLLASMEGMDVRATGMNETVAQAEMNVDMEEVETLVDSVEIDVIEATTPETQVSILTEKDKYYKPYEDATYELWYYENEDSIEIKGIRGTDSGKLLIPDKIEGKVVNKIGDYAFSSYSGFTGILDIPNTIEYIGKNAFSSCSGFTGDLFIPESVKMISDTAFWGCKGFDGGLTISEGVTSIGYMAFYDCRGFKGDLVIPNGVTSIGDEAFRECSGFEGDLIIGEGVISIGKNAFRYTGFKGTLTLPESLVTVKQQAFEDVGFTGDLTIPANVKTIEKYGFEGLKNITGTLKVSGSIEEWDELAFHYGGYSEIIIEGNVTNIPKNAFAYCKNAEKISLPNSLKTIEYGAFQECDSLKTVTIPSGVTSIGDFAFAWCNELSGELKLPEGLQHIGYGAFTSCPKLTGELRIPESITTIGESAFSSCEGLTAVVFPSGLITISNSAFLGCSGLTGDLVFPQGLKTIGSGAFQRCSGLNGKVVVPKSVNSILGNAFSFAASNQESIPVIIYGTAGTYAETYAYAQGYGFVDKDGKPGKYPLPDNYEQQDVVPLEQYYVLLLDEKGELVKDAEIAVTNVAGQAEYDFTYEEGIIRIQVGQGDGKCVDITAKKEGMITVSERQRLVSGGSNYLKFRKESVDPCINNVMITDFNNQYNIITRHNYVVYKSDANMGFTLTLRTDTSGEEPSTYKLVQGDKIIATSGTNRMTINPSKDLELGGPTPEMVTYDLRGRELARKKVLFVVMENGWSGLLNGDKVGIGEGFTFSTSDTGIPIFSNTEVTMDIFNEWPIKAEVEGNKVRIEIGSGNILEDDDEEGDDSDDSKKKFTNPMDKFKEKVKEYKNTLKYGNIDAHLSAMSKSGNIGNFEASIDVVGYGEGYIDPATKAANVEVAVYVTVSSGEGSITWYYFVGVIPFYAKISGEADATLTGKGNLKFYDGRVINPNVALDIDVNLALGVGAGVGYNDAACIDINMQGTLGWQHHPIGGNADTPLSTVSLQVDGYSRAVLLFYERKDEWLSKSWQLYPELKALSAGNGTSDPAVLQASEFQVMSRNYLLDNGSLPILKSNGDDTQVIINGLYPDAKPKLVTYKGTDYLFYLDDQKDRGLEDRTALVYRKEANGTFGESVIIEDDKTGDFDYDVKAAEDGIYVLWQDGNKSLQGITTLEEAAEALTLSAAKVTDKGVTLLESPAVTEGLAPISPVLVDNGKEMMACWYENSSNDLLQSGQGTSRFYGQAVGAKGEKQKIGETVRTITTTDFGMFENALSVAYTVDEDNDVSTVEDREIYVASKGETKRLTDNEVIDSNALFGTVSGKQVLVYYSDKNLACTDGTSTKLLMDAEDPVVTNGLISDDFQFTSESANPAIVWKDAYWMGEEAGQGMTMIRFKDGTWGKPTRVAGTTDSLVAYSVLEKNADMVRVVYTAKGELDGKEITRLYETEGRERASIGLVRISYEQEDYVPGKNLPFSVTLQNTGAIKAEDYEITILNEAGETIFTQKGSEAISVGEEKVITLANFSPADSGDLQTLKIQINGDGRKQDTMEFTLGGADLSLRTDISYEEEEQILNLQMINGSNLTENMKLTITDTEEAVLYEKEYQSVPGKSSVNYLCKLDKFFDMTEADSIKLSLESMGRTETYLFDNETTLYRPGTVTKITEVTLEQKEMELTSGETAQLKVTKDGEGTVLYESNNPDCVSVSESGVVKAKAPGSATITAYTEDGGRAICIITVKEAAPSKPTIVLGDVAESSWQYKYVKYACENDYMKGKKTDEAGRILFDPEGTLTRAEFVQVLYNAEGKPAVTYKDRFSDVPENQWYTNAIIWATEKGIVNGYGNGKYGVSDSITREQLATMLNKYAQYKGYKVDATAELDTYTDTGKISGWAVNYMKWIVGSSIMSGKGDRLDPQGNATRAECATLVNKFHICYGE